MNDFSADELNADQVEEKLDLFLERFILTLSTGDLSAKAAQNLLYRKLCGTALVLLKDYMILQSPSSDKEYLRIMIHFLETRFLRSANPILANAKLRQIEQGSLSFAQLQAKISKLAFYSTLDEDPDKRTALSQSRGLEQFKIAIREVDRNMLYNEDKTRQKSNLPPLTLIGASMFLENFYQEQKVYTAISKHEGKSGSLLNINKTPYREGPDKPYPKKGQFDKGFRPNQQKKDQPKFGNKKITNDSLGIPKQHCLLCGKKGHGYTSCFLYPN